MIDTVFAVFAGVVLGFMVGVRAATHYYTRRLKAARCSRLLMQRERDSARVRATNAVDECDRLRSDALAQFKATD